MSYIGKILSRLWRSEPGVTLFATSRKSINRNTSQRCRALCSRSDDTPFP